MPSQLNPQFIDICINKIDQVLQQQLDAILHHPEFQTVEASWRSLYYLVEHTEFRENIKIDFIDCDKPALQNDFNDANELCKSNFYKLLYSHEYGQLGGEPYTAVITDFEFSHTSSDIKLLQNLSAVAATAHAPILSSAAPRLFGINSYTEFANLKDIKVIFASEAYAKWNSLRASENARYLGLTLPKFLLRPPYDPEENPCQSFSYCETTQQHQDYLWGSATFALANRITDSFARYRWCPNIIGPQNGGTVPDLPRPRIMAAAGLESKIPTETILPDRREYELAEAGFIPLSFRKGSDEAIFFSANSMQKPKFFGTANHAKAAEINYKLGTQLPYMFIICRIAHYLKVLQREGIGSWQEANDLELSLNNWLNQYIANQENAPAHIRSQKPLRNAAIKVSNSDDDPGWYKVDINVRPHFKYMGADITLSLASRIEQHEH